MTDNMSTYDTIQTNFDTTDTTNININNDIPITTEKHCESTPLITSNYIYNTTHKRYMYLIIIYSIIMFIISASYTYLWVNHSNLMIYKYTHISNHTTNTTNTTFTANTDCLHRYTFKIIGICYSIINMLVHIFIVYYTCILLNNIRFYEKLCTTNTAWNTITYKLEYVFSCLGCYIVALYAVIALLSIIYVMLLNNNIYTANSNICNLTILNYSLITSLNTINIIAFTMLAVVIVTVVFYGIYVVILEFINCISNCISNCINWRTCYITNTTTSPHPITCNICLTHKHKFVVTKCKCKDLHICVDCVKKMHDNNNAFCPFCRDPNALIP